MGRQCFLLRVPAAGLVLVAFVAGVALVSYGGTVGAEPRRNRRRPAPPTTQKAPADVEAYRNVLFDWAIKPPYGLRAKSTHPKMAAIDSLGSLGTEEAVVVLRDMLTAHRAHNKMKAHALLTLARIGTEPAIAAIEHFEKWAEQRRASPAAFRFGEHDHPIWHFAELDVKPVAEVTDERGEKWAVFVWRRDGSPHLWLTRQPKGGQWRDPVVLSSIELARDDYHKTLESLTLVVKNWQVIVTLRGKTHTFEFNGLWLDTDTDGLPDATEKILGTDPAKADSDGDGKSDLADPCPLLPKPKKPADENAAVRQAVMTYFFATRNSRDFITLVDRGRPEDEFARQEYTGFAGCFLRDTAIVSGRANITGLTIGDMSADTATARISDWVGNMASSSVEVRLKKIHGKWVVVSLGSALIS